MIRPLKKAAATIVMHRGEVAHVDKPERMPTGDISTSFVFNIAAGDPTDSESIARVVRGEMDAWLRNNRAGFRSGIVRTAQRG
jgi:hypothetical protein